MRRVTVTMPDDVLEQIDRWDANRSRFVTEAARRELERLRREELERSLRNPHAESGRVAETGVDEWGAGLEPVDDGLLEPEAGRPVRWDPDAGWGEKSE